MGLDAVEIIMKTEQEFGIVILDEEAEAVITVGHLYELVLNKLDGDSLQKEQTEKRWKSQHSKQDIFVQLQGVIVECIGVDIQDVVYEAEFIADLKVE